MFVNRAVSFVIQMPFYNGISQNINVLDFYIEAFAKERKIIPLIPSLLLSFVKICEGKVLQKLKIVLYLHH